jgi:hypothetical protein
MVEAAEVEVGGMRERGWIVQMFGWLARVGSHCWTLGDYARKDWQWM